MFLGLGLCNSSLGSHLHMAFSSVSYEDTCHSLDLGPTWLILYHLILKTFYFFQISSQLTGSGVQDVDTPLKSTVQHTAVSLEVVSVVGRHRP